MFAKKGATPSGSPNVSQSQRKASKPLVTIPTALIWKSKANMKRSKNEQKRKALKGGQTLKEFQESESCSSTCIIPGKEEDLETTLQKIDSRISESLTELSEVDGKPEEVEAEEKLSTEEFDKVYQSALSAVVNASVRLPRKLEEYEEYLQKACKMGAEKHQVLKRRVEYEVAEVRLHIQVIEADGLLAKDANGFSDPYCRLALVHEREVGKPHRDISHWEKKKIVHTVKETNVINKTLTPVWNESKEMLLLDPKSEYLALEVWDSDAETESILKAKGLSGIKNYIHDLNGKDSFLGKLYIPLHELSIEGGDRWYPLQSHRGNPRGKIKLHLQIHSKMPTVKQDSVMTVYCQLYRLLVSYKRNSEGDFADDWNGQVDPVGNELLRLYASRVDLQSLHEAVCKIKILYRDKLTYPVAILTFVEVLRDSRKDLEQDCAAKPPKPWVGQLIKSLSSMRSDVIGAVYRHHNLVTLKTGAGVGLLRVYLKLIKTIYQVDSFVITLDRDTAHLVDVVTIALRRSSATWYQKLITTAVAAVEGNQKVVVTIAAVRGMINFLSRSQSELKPIFEDLGVDYFDVVYRDVDQQLAGDLEEIMPSLNRSSSSSESSTDVYLLYQAVARYSALASQLTRGKETSGLKLTEFYILFKPFVQGWIAERMEVFEKGMWKAVKCAEAVPVVEEVKYSTAVRDTIDLMIRVCGFLKGLDWQQPEEYVTFLLIIIQRLCEKVLKFVNYIANKLRAESYYLIPTTLDGFKVQKVSEKLCIHLNDIQQLRTCLKDLPNYLEWEQQKKSITEEKSVDSVDRVFDTISTLLSSTDEDMDHEMTKVYCDVSLALKVSITALFKNIAFSSETYERKIENLFEYFADILKVLFNSLFDVVFNGILESIWVVVVSVVVDLSQSHETKDEANKLQQILGASLAYFNSGGDGLPEKALRTKEYLKVNRCLKLKTDRTELVVAQYLLDLVDYQEGAGRGGGSRGSLTCSLGYNDPNEVLEITVIRGSGMPSLDTLTNSSDPFVVIELLPKTTFPQVKTAKTATLKATLDPVYNEDFRFQVMREELDQRGSVVMFLVYDHDYITSNDVIGVAVVAGSDVPTINAQTADSILNSSGRLTLTLPLFLLPETAALRELQDRSAHKCAIASDFLKKAKKLM